MAARGASAAAGETADRWAHWQRHTRCVCSPVARVPGGVESDRLYRRPECGDRISEGRNDKLSEFAVDLVRREVAVIVAPTTPSVLAAKAATKTIPIVFFTAGDPVDLGLVAGLSRPDSNLTGATTLTLEVGPKWLQFLHEMVPHATSLALLINPTSPYLAEAQSRALDVQSRSVVESAMLMLHSGRPYGTDSSRQRQDHARRPSCYTAIEGFDPRARQPLRS